MPLIALGRPRKRTDFADEIVLKIQDFETRADFADRFNLFQVQLVQTDLFQIAEHAIMVLCFLADQIKR